VRYRSAGGNRPIMALVVAVIVVLVVVVGWYLFLAPR
jgi:hypothetical protein